MRRPLTRFAPSPTGRLHLGHAYSAMACWFAAGALGGTCLLRIEDIDPGRCRPEFEAGIYEDLAWLGLAWPEPVRRQSAHLADYRPALARLDDMGLLYPCFATRSEIAAAVAERGAPMGPDGPVYPGLHRDLGRAEIAERIARGERHALRLRMDEAVRRAGPLTWDDDLAGPQAADPGRFGDVVLARKDVATSYHLSVVVDDALQEIDLVVRGRDLFQETDVHRLLQALLGLPVPRYRHHDLVIDPETGERMAKRNRSTTIASLRAAGLSPAEVLARAGWTADA